ncbi:YtzI protein [Bacillus sp. DTU_2020_1000418_1_SI_GHA_SEK_038]|uniref:YtzI protein n=1 Tax=Bacillus sp. DTU_2020_1000418_1_SI_GHA_SEK_038 TaxID=3077585 RepID=UPI0028E53843|nr:YtzI protein [Bacillus sp. DTU_2020_1000418_1_SI_GHA_SEK_038]WNS74682.1 YtzI protein [Bacillus sp. DTU_2020_1000418_1_SI_GHA_SEK_038]
MITVLAISVIIVAIVIVLAVVTTSKAYMFKHTVDSIDSIPTNDDQKELENKSDKEIS